MNDIHPAAARGFALGAETYARGRPDYPADIADWLASKLGLGPGSRALDLGAGTGKFTPYLKRTGAEVTVVEPVDAMRAELTARNPDVRALAGSATAIPLPDASVDAVVCAQSFHWFATREALAEIHRVLKPGGHLGLVWNIRDDSVDWVAALAQIIAPYESDTPRHASGAWRRLFPGDGFGPLSESRFPHGHTGPAEEVILSRTLSISFVAALPEPERQKVEFRIRELIAATPALSRPGDVTFPYETMAYSSARLPAP